MRSFLFETRYNRVEAVAFGVVAIAFNRGEWIYGLVIAAIAVAISVWGE